MVNVPVELLSICIPTRNRAPFLRSLLDTISKQMREAGLSAREVKVYVSDNASEDGTDEMCKGFHQVLDGFVYSRNVRNIGGDENIFHVRTLAKGRFQWVLGDDELIMTGALKKLICLLRDTNPGLVIAINCHYTLQVPPPQAFTEYREFAKACLRVNPHVLAEPTLVSSNIVRADCFDFVYAESQLQTHFAHLHGMIPSLQRVKATVVLPEFPIVAVRKNPTSPVDNAPWINLDASWISYFSWLRQVLELPELDPQEPSRIARKIMIRNLRRNTLSYIWIHKRELVTPSAWRFFIKRLLGRT